MCLCVIVILVCMIECCCDSTSVHCCSLCFLVLWIISGIYGLIVTNQYLDKIENGSWMTESPCDDNTDYDECCVATINDYEYAWDGSCDKLESALTVEMVTSAS